LSVDSTPAAQVQRQEPAERVSAALRAVPWKQVIICLLLFSIAMLPRTAWAVYTDREPQGLNDPTMYNLLADIMADGGGYSRPTGEPFAYYPVGFPATVAGLKKAGDVFGWGRSIISIKLMQAVFGALTVVLLYGIGRRIFDQRVALAGALLLAFFPSQIYYTGTILSEPLFTMLFVGALLVLLWQPWTRDGMPLWQVFGAGVILSAATMTRGITLVFPLVFLAIWFFYLHSRKRAAIQTLVLFAGIAVLILPWSVRNSVQFGTIVGPSTNLGDDLCIGNFDGATGAFMLEGPDGQPIKCFQGHEDLSPDEMEVTRNREGLRIAVEDVVSNPVRMPRLIMRKAYWLLYRDDDGLFAAESYGHDRFIGQTTRDILSFAANSIYYATGVVVMLGMAAFALSRDIRRLVIVASMLYVLAVPLGFFGDPRFHFPAIPLAALIAAAACVWIWDRRHRPLLKDYGP
jgi:hypothetical protein